MIHPHTQNINTPALGPNRTGLRYSSLVCGALAAGVLASGGMTACRSIQTNDGTKIRRNLPAEKIPGKFGQPDIIRQTRGAGESEAGQRYYFPDQPPTETWEGKDVVTEYYYTDRGYKIIITEGRVRDSESISDAETTEIFRRIRERREAPAAPADNPTTR